MEQGKEIRFSVIIPLYNKRGEVARAVLSAVQQRYAPLEVIVVDDGSTDGSADVVRALDSSLVRLIVQPNGGVCVARNTAIEQAKGDYIAMLDADDWWDDTFLEEVASLIAESPNCGIYSTSHRIVKGDVAHDIDNYDQRGVVREFFRLSMRYTICLPSLCVVPKSVFDAVGLFPVGMKLGEDQYMWTKIARKFDVCFSPRRCVNYSISASNRSSSIFVEERCKESFDEFYDPSGDEWCNEYIARCSIGKALTISAKGADTFPRHVENFYGYTKRYRLGLWKLRMLNRLPHSVRWFALSAYARLSWVIAKKGTL